MECKVWLRQKITGGALGMPFWVAQWDHEFGCIQEETFLAADEETAKAAIARYLEPAAVTFITAEEKRREAEKGLTVCR